MVRYLFLLLAIMSCSSSNKNEFGRTRQSVSVFSFKAIENIESYKIIDTSAFYKLVLDENLIKSRKNRYESLEMIEGLKFYKNGRVGYFRDVDFDSIETLNPKKAIMGLYDFSNNLYFAEAKGTGGYTMMSKKNVGELMELVSTIDFGKETLLTAKTIDELIQ